MFADEFETEEGFRFTWVDAKHPAAPKGSKVRKFRVLRRNASQRGAFMNINSALDYVSEGDRVAVGDGEWQGNLTIPKRIELCADSDCEDSPIVHTREDICVACKSHDGCLIRGLRIQCRGQVAGYGLAVIEGEAHVHECDVDGVRIEGERGYAGKLRMRSCNVRRSAEHAVYVHHEGSCVIDGCQIGTPGKTEVGNRAVYVSSIGDVVFDGCTVHSGSGGCVVVAGGVSSVSGTEGRVQPVFRKCTIEDNIGSVCPDESDRKPLPHPDIVSRWTTDVAEPSSGAAVMCTSGCSPLFQDCSIVSRCGSGIISVDANPRFSAKGKPATEISDCGKYGVVITRVDQAAAFDPPVLDKVKVSGCKAGGVRMYEDPRLRGAKSAAEIRDCSFSDNGGPGLLLEGSGCCPDVTGCVFTCQAAGAPGVVAVGGARGALVSCEWTDNAVGVCVETRANPSFEHCKFEKCATAVVLDRYALGTFSQCTVTRCGSGGGAVDVLGGANPTFDGCTWRGNGKAVAPGTRASFEADSSVGPGVRVAGGRGVFRGCTFSDQLAGAPHMSVKDLGNPTVTTSSFRFGETGVWCGSRARGRFVDNVLEQLQDGVVLVDGADATLRGNSIKELRGVGIVVRNALGTFVDNQVSLCLSHGVLCDWGGDPDFRRNEVRCPRGKGVHVKFGGCGRWSHNYFVGSLANVDISGTRPKMSHVRLTPLSRRGSPGADDVGMIQLGSLELFDSDSKPLQIQKATGAKAGVDVPENAIPGAENRKKRWRDRAGGPLTFALRPSAIRSYRLQTAGDDPNSDPVEWKLEGSTRSDQGPWYTLAIQTGEATPVPVGRWATTEKLATVSLLTAPHFYRNDICDPVLREKPDEGEDEEWVPQGGGIGVWVRGRDPADSLAGVYFQGNRFVGNSQTHALLLLSADAQGTYKGNRFQGRGSGAGLVAQLKGAGHFIRNSVSGRFPDGSVLLRRQCMVVCEDCDVTNEDGAGVVAVGDAGGKVLLSRIRGCAGPGVLCHKEMQGSRFASFVENDIFGNKGGGVHCTTGCRVSFERNEVHDNKDQGFLICSAASPEVRENTVHSERDGVVIRDGGKGIILRNVVRDCGSNLVVIGELADPTVKDNELLRGPVGIRCADHSAEGVVIGNKVRGCERGASIVNYASPHVMRNIFGSDEPDQANDVGVEVADEGRGDLSKNQFVGNRLGLLVTSSGDPLLSRNLFDGLTRKEGVEAGARIEDAGKGRFCGNQFVRFCGDAVGVDVRRGGRPVFDRGDADHDENTFDANTTGLRCHGGGAGDFSGCKISGSERAGVEIVDAGTAPRIHQCQLLSNPGVGVWVHDKGRGTIESCSFERNAVGVHVQRRGHPDVVKNKFVFGGGAELKEAVAILVDDGGGGRFAHNDVTGFNPSGMRVGLEGDPLVEDSTFTASQYAGIELSTGAKGHYLRNTINGGAAAGIRVDGRGAGGVWRANDVHENRVGVVVSNEGRGEWTENDVHGNKEAGVLTREGADPAFGAGNVIRDNGDGVLAESGGKGQFTKTLLTSNRKTGVKVTRRGAPVLSECTIDGNGGQDEGRFGEPTGGAVFLLLSNGVVKRSTLTGNQPDNAVFSDAASPQLLECLVRGAPRYGVRCIKAGGGRVSRSYSVDNGEAALYAEPFAGVRVDGNLLHGGVARYAAVIAPPSDDLEKKGSPPSIRDNVIEGGTRASLCVLPGGAANVARNFVGPEVPGPGSSAGVLLCNGAAGSVSENWIAHSPGAGVLLEAEVPGEQDEYRRRPTSTALVGNFVYANKWNIQSRGGEGKIGHAPGATGRVESGGEWTHSNVLADGRECGVDIRDGGGAVISGMEVVANDVGVRMHSAGSAVLADSRIFLSRSAGVEIKGNVGGQVFMCDVARNGDGVRLLSAVGASGAETEVVKECNVYMNTNAGIVARGESSVAVDGTWVSREGRTRSGVAGVLFDNGSAVLRRCAVLHCSTGIVARGADSYPVGHQIDCYDNDGVGLSLQDGAVGEWNSCNFADNAGAGVALDKASCQKAVPGSFNDCVILFPHRSAGTNAVDVPEGMSNPVKYGREKGRGLNYYANDQHLKKDFHTSNGIDMTVQGRKNRWETGGGKRYAKHQEAELERAQQILQGIRKEREEAGRFRGRTAQLVMEAVRQQLAAVELSDLGLGETFAAERHTFADYERLQDKPPSPRSRLVVGDRYKIRKRVRLGGIEALRGEVMTVAQVEGGKAKLKNKKGKVASRWLGPEELAAVGEKDEAAAPAQTGMTVYFSAKASNQNAQRLTTALESAEGVSLDSFERVLERVGGDNHTAPDERARAIWAADVYVVLLSVDHVGDEVKEELAIALRKQAYLQSLPRAGPAPVSILLVVNSLRRYPLLLELAASRAGTGAAPSVNWLEGILERCGYVHVPAQPFAAAELFADVTKAFSESGAPGLAGVVAKWTERRLSESTPRDSCLGEDDAGMLASTSKSATGRRHSRTVASACAFGGTFLDFTRAVNSCSYMDEAAGHTGDAFPHTASGGSGPQPAEEVSLFDAPKVFVCCASVDGAAVGELVRDVLLSDPRYFRGFAPTNLGQQKGGSKYLQELRELHTTCLAIVWVPSDNFMASRKARDELDKMRYQSVGKPRPLVTVELGVVNTALQSARRECALLAAERGRQPAGARYHRAVPGQLRDRVLVRWLASTLDRVLREDADFHLPPAQARRRSVQGYSNVSFSLGHSVLRIPSLSAKRKSLGSTQQHSSGAGPAVVSPRAAAPARLPLSPRSAVSGSGPDRSVVSESLSRPVTTWTVDDVIGWLHHDVEAPQYETAVVEGRLRGDRLVHCDDSDLRRFGICHPADRARMIERLAVLRKRDMEAGEAVAP